MAGFFDENLSATAGSGFATGSTDAGRANVTQFDDSWSGNDQLTINFAYLSVHEMTVVGKALAEDFYGHPVEYSYWNGCSNGGRQGYVAAQRYPNDYDGIMANSPGINWDRFLVADIWGKWLVLLIVGPYFDPFRIYPESILTIADHSIVRKAGFPLLFTSGFN